MSFLPHGAPRPVPWYGSFAASLLAHAGIVSFVLFSGMIVLVPEPVIDDAPEITVSLEILDANIVDQLEPVDDSNLVPEDALVTEPDSLEAQTPDDLAALTPPDDEAMLTPEDDGLLAPQDDALLEPELDAAEPEVLEPEPLEPEVTEPEVFEPEPVEPEVAQPEVIEPEPTEPEVAEILPEPENEPLLVPEDVAEPEVLEPEVQPEIVAEAEVLPEPEALPLPEPEAESPLAIDDLSPIDDSVVNPLATGGGGGAPVEDDVLALVAPEPEQPEIPLIAPEVEAEPAPVALPEDVLQPENAETGAPTVPEPAPEVAALAPEEEEEEEEGGEEADGAEDDADEAEDDAEEAEDVAAAPPAILRQPLANPTASDVAIGRLLRRIRDTPGEPCTLALPRRAGGDALAGLSMIGADEAVLDEAALHILEELDFAPIQTRELLDPRQCATLDALRQSESYPANRIGLTVNTGILSSGEMLSGRVVGAGGLYVTLLLVDDNGVVQDLAPFVTLDGTTPVFEVPVARSGPTRATRQVLVAIGTRGTPLDLSDRIGREAQEVFGQIPSETLKSMVFGVTTFDVQ